MRSVSFSDGGLCDRDIIFRDEKDLVQFFSLAAWLSFRHAKLTAGAERRVRILAIECVSFCPFFPSSRFRIFSRSNAHTKGDREQFASLDF